MPLDDDRPLHPFPDGWFLVTPSDRLGTEQLLQKQWMGQQIVAWRDRAGAVCVADAFCPHLGAHLGPESGGVVRDDRLVCPFHGFQFDATGRCAGTPLGPPPQKACLQTYPVQETGGFIFAYHDHQGRPPTWRIPEADGGHRGRVLTKLRLRTHPQVTTENSVDFGHLLHIHGYHDLKQLAPAVIDGPFLTSSYSFSRYMLTRGLRALRFSMEIRISVYGLGLSLVHVHGTTGVRLLQWVMAAPVDGDVIDLWLAVDPQGRQRLPWLRLLPAWISNRLAPRIILHELVHDVRKDYRIWEHHRYRHDPVFSKGDADIYRFRRYSEQFYPAPLPRLRRPRTGGIAAP